MECLLSNSVRKYIEEEALVDNESIQSEEDRCDSVHQSEGSEGITHMKFDNLVLSYSPPSLPPRFV